MTRARRLTTVALLGLVGCTVGPDFTRPEPVSPPAWTTAFGDQAGNPSKLKRQPAQLAEWWNVFEDPPLARLTRHALESNLDLRRATLRVREARARLASVTAERLPKLSANSSYQHRRISENGIASALGGSEGGSDEGGAAIPGGRLRKFDLFQTGFDASWEWDIFGGTRRRIEAVEATLAASLANRNSVRVSTAAEVARNYFQLRGAQRRLAITRDNLEAQRESLRLTREREAAGLASELQSLRAEARLARTRAALPPLRTRRRQAGHRLSVLTGRPPGTLQASLTEPRPLPELPPKIPVGLPSELLRRRPDVRQAEHALHAATAEVGVAVARLFPNFSLTGSFGFQSTNVDELAQWQSRFFGIGPSLRLPIFEGGRLRARIRVQKAQRERALNRYYHTVLVAFQEVEDGLTAYRNDQIRRRSLAAATQANGAAVELAQDRYRQGLADYLEVLDAQRALLRSQDALARSAIAMRTDLVSLYKALGGGWQPSPTPKRNPDPRDPP